MSDNTRRMIDDEQQYLTDLAHRRATALIEENRPLLEAFASTLLENEVLERDDIDRIMAAQRGAPNGNGSLPPGSRERPAVAASEGEEPAQGPSLDQPGS
jgi:cell division protease FtsH